MSQIAMTDTQGILMLNSHDSVTRKTYQALARERLERIQSDCRQFQISYVPVMTTSDLGKLVYHTILHRAH